jgi:hypothetical protein
VRVRAVVALTLVALALGTSFAHVLEWPAKLQFDGPFYVQLQTSLYERWGPPSLTGFIEPAAIVAVFVLAWGVRRHSALLRPVLLAALLLLLAFPGVYFWWVEPANAVFRGADPSNLPADWVIWRTRWEMGHAIRFALHLCAFMLLAGAIARSPRRVMPGDMLV